MERGSTTWKAGLSRSPVIISVDELEIKIWVRHEKGVRGRREVGWSIDESGEWTGCCKGLQDLTSRTGSWTRWDVVRVVN
jgi:hypothetical protein